MSLSCREQQAFLLWVQQLQALLASGLPMLNALSLLAQSQSAKGASRWPWLHQLTAKHEPDAAQLKACITQGLSLAQAMREQSQVFDPLFCQLIQVGEAGAGIVPVLDRLIVHGQKRLQQRRQLRARLAYPLTLLLTGLVLTSLMLIWVVPAFAQLFAAVAVPLPWATRLLLDISHFFSSNPLGWTDLALFIIVIGAAWRWGGLRSRVDPWLIKGTEYADLALLHCPGIGAIRLAQIMACWTRTFHSLSGSGMPLLPILQACALSSGHIKYLRLASPLQQAVQSGQTLSQALRETKAFPEWVLQLCAAGEHSGRLGAMMGQLADNYELLADASMQRWLSLMEPLLVMLMAGLIGGMMLAVYWPIFLLGQLL
jgi:type IV pilus assembly protein PilC